MSDIFGIKKVAGLKARSRIARGFSPGNRIPYLSGLKGRPQKLIEQLATDLSGRYIFDNRLTPALKDWASCSRGFQPANTMIQL